ncbi:hypothetical protein I6A60_31265 [Frankia sp. AgB1.9]|uniref:hypothetical protein n=1 Tax=Frankia sp. AgB1.9 TaxID=1836968 RepID=UPI001932CF4B|nr:hypothetical protein [Frankia sp. AgB1.9]MBL7552310.1 hypothetical protein [Frankia sp. AgB1.9]
MVISYHPSCRFPDRMRLLAHEVFRRFRRRGFAVAGTREELRFDLTGRDISMSRALRDAAEQARQTDEQLDDLTGERTADIRVETEGSDLDAVRRDLDRFRGDYTARVRVEIEPEGALDALRADLDRFDGRRVEARIDLDGLDHAADQLADLSVGLAWLDARDRIEIPIRVDIDSIAEVELLRDLLERVQGTYTARVRVEESGGGSLRQAGDDAGRLGGIFDGLKDRAKGAATGLLGVGTSAVKLAGEAAGAVEVGVHLLQWVGQMAPAAAIAAPAVLTMAQGMGTLKLVSDEASRQLQTLTPQFTAIKSAAEKAFAPGFADGLKRFATDLPVVQEGVRATADVLGDLAATAGAVFSGPMFRADLATVMTGNAAATRAFGNAGIQLASAFFDVAVAAEPAFVNLSHLVEVGADAITQWVDAKKASGDLAASIQKGADSVGKFLTGLFRFGEGAHAIFGALKTDGTDLSASILKIGTAFDSWATSETTLNNIDTILQNIKFYANETWTALQAGFNGTVSDGGWVGVLERLGAEGKTLYTFITTQLIPTFTSLISLVTGPFGAAFMSATAAVRDLALNGISGLLEIVRNQLVPFFNDHVAPLLNDVIIPAFQRLSTWIEDHLFPAVQKVAGILVDHFGPALDQIRQKIEDNKPQLEVFVTGLEKLGTVIVDLATSAIGAYLIASLKAMVIEIEAVITIISTLMEAAANLAIIMLQAFAAIIEGFKAIFDAAATAVAGTLRVWATLLGPLGEPFRRAASDVDAFKGNVDRDLDAVVGKAHSAADGINGWLDSVHDKTVTLTVVTQQINKGAGMDLYDSRIPGNRWTGGPVSAGSPYLVGERGQELFIPKVPGTIIDHATTNALLSRHEDVYDGSLTRSSRAAGGGWDGAAAPVTVIQYISVGAGVIATPGQRRELAEALADSITDVQVNRRGSNGRRPY